MTMKYKPPVKSSVSKIQTSRLGKGISSDSIQDFHKSSDVPSRSPTSKSAYAAGATLAVPPAGIGRRAASSFERRMRDLVFRDNKTKSTMPTKTRSRTQRKDENQQVRQLPSNVHVVETLREYRDVVADEKQRMVVVRFYAPWCKACKAVAPLFYRLAKENPHTVFVDVPVGERNSNLYQGLGVERLPFCHIYHPKGGLVEELRFTRAHFRNVSKIFQTYLQGMCTDLEIDDETGMFSSPYRQPQNLN